MATSLGEAFNANLLNSAYKIDLVSHPTYEGGVHEYKHHNTF